VFVWGGCWVVVGVWVSGGVCVWGWLEGGGCGGPRGRVWGGIGLWTCFFLTGSARTKVTEQVPQKNDRSHRWPYLWGRRGKLALGILLDTNNPRTRHCFKDYFLEKLMDALDERPKTKEVFGSERTGIPDCRNWRIASNEKYQDQYQPKRVMPSKHSETGWILYEE